MSLSLDQLLGTSVVREEDAGDRAKMASSLELLRATQELRTAQSARTFPFVLGCVALLLFELWDIVPHHRLLFQGGLLVTSNLLRIGACHFIRGGLETATQDRLANNERALFWTAVLNSAAMGSGFWLVAGPEKATFDISLGSCFFAIGAMVNASVRARSFLWSISANIGQGILFAFGLGPHFYPFLGFLFVAVLVALIGFGQRNEQRFNESFRIRDTNRRLAERLAAENRLVEEALKRAQKAATQQGRFLAAASHDLRQPLHAMMLYLDPLKRQLKGHSTEPIIDRLIESADLLASQLGDMLDLSKLDAGAVEVHAATFELQPFLERLVEDFRPIAERQKLELRREVCSVPVHTDPTLLDRVARNLLSNALRYTKTGEVLLSATQEGERVRVSVRDTGIGIPEEDTGRIFEDFVQLENPARARARGVGLGLANVRRISQLLHFDLQLQSQPGVGSEFIFWIPKATEQARLQRPHSELALPAPGLEVWAVEDDPHVAAALELQLRTYGCLAKLAQSDEQVRELARKSGFPRLALVDDMLETGRSGLEIAEWIRSEQSGNENATHVVLLTGNADTDRLETIRRSGFPLLQKPLRPGELESLLLRVSAASR